MTEVNDIHLSSINQNFVVHVDGTLGDREIRALTNEILEPEIAIVMDASIVERKFIREQRSRHRLVTNLRWVVHALNHVSFLCLMAKNASCGLILVNKSKFTTSLVEQDLLYHSVCSSRVSDCPIKSEEPQRDHYWKHDRVCSVKWVLLDKYSEDCQWHQKPHE